jgi:hypothetical protein
MALTMQQATGIQGDRAARGFHTCAFQLPFLSTGTAPSPGVVAVLDGYLAPCGTTGFLGRKPMRLIAGYANSAADAASTNGLLTTIQLDVPAFGSTGLPYFRPLGGASGILDALPGDDPKLMVSLYDGPIVPPNEPMTIQGARIAGGAANGVVVLWLAYSLEPLPPGEVFTIQYTSDTDVAAFAWTTIAPTWSKSLPNGRYAVVGFEHIGDKAVAARLDFGEGPRPGTLAQATRWGRTHRIFYEGELGVYGYFDAPTMPNIQVLAAAADSTAQLGYLRVIRIGDVGCPCR